MQEYTENGYEFEPSATDYEDYRNMDKAHDEASVQLLNTSPVLELGLSVKKPEHRQDVRLTGKQSHDGNTIARMLRDKLKYDPKQQMFFYFNKVWRQCDTDTVKKKIKRIMDHGIPDGYCDSRLKGTFNIVKVELSISQSDDNHHSNWEANRNLLPMDNGMLDMNTGELLPHDPKFLINWILPHVWTGKPSGYPTIKRFLRSVANGDRNIYEVLMCFLAATLRGMPNIQKFLEMIGTPGTGKSTFIKLACEIVGDRNIVITQMKPLQDNRFETSNLRGKRLVVISDADRYAGAVEVFKAVTGRDPIRNEKKYQHQDSGFVYEGQTVVAANQPVQYKDNSTAILRRRIPVHIDHRLKDEDHDPELFKKMKCELSGLIYDLLNMTHDHIEHILEDRSNARIKSKCRGMVEANPLAAWLDECVIPDPEYKSRMGNLQYDDKTKKLLHTDDWLYPNYAAWVDSTGRKGRVASNTFKKTMTEYLDSLGLKYFVGKDRQGSFIEGLRLKDEEDYGSNMITGEKSTSESATHFTNEPEA